MKACLLASLDSAFHCMKRTKTEGGQPRSGSAIWSRVFEKETTDRTVCAESARQSSAPAVGGQKLGEIREIGE